ncbi:hypothetical protein [Sphingomonas sp.]|uniref:phage fiber-tail adaptor protein n=1 Tax=Sphingomonas sp. TaxID=28214 RepID=UPI0025DA81E1|nr:hypothetical protein [Sphingomonas sp.]MBV9529247.1 hypothetical protein [Sphingomonas sp.]
MNYLLKDPDAVLDYSVDWGAEYLGGDLLAESTWSVVPDEAGGVSVQASDFDATTTSVTAAGGIAGRVYRLVNAVVLMSGRADSRSIVLRVEGR